MSQGRRPALGAVGGSFPQQGNQYIGQQMPLGPSPGQGPQQRFMTVGQLPNHVYGHSLSQSHLYMPSVQQPPGPPVSPGGKPPTPQQSQLQQIQNMMQNSPSQLSPSDHEINNIEDPSGDNSRSSSGGPRPTPSPVSSTGSRSNTPASIPGVQTGSPMPVRPPASQADGQNRLTHSPMATQGYNQQMMPPPNNMGFMPKPGKMSGSQTPGPYPQYNPQYPHGNYTRQQPTVGAMNTGPPSSVPIQGYPGAMYSNGPSQIPGTPMYSNMPGMVRNMGQQGFSQGQGPYSQSSTNIGMMNSSYPGFNSHIGPTSGHHVIQQTSEGSGPPLFGSSAGPPVSNTGIQQGGIMNQQLVSSNKAVQPSQTALQMANNSVGPRMSHNIGSMSSSAGMFMQSAGSPLAHMNSMTNSPNLGSPSLNNMSHAVEQVTRSSSGGMPTSSMGNVSTSNSSPVPKSSLISAAMINNTSTSIVNSDDHNTRQPSSMSGVETQELLPRPGSGSIHRPEPPHESAVGSDNSVCIPNDSTSVDSGFHSSDQGDKTDSTGSLALYQQPSSDGFRTVENISPPEHPNHHSQQHFHHYHLQQQHLQQQHFMGPESKMPYNSDVGVHLPPSAMSAMPSSSSIVVTTANAGPLLTSVTQSIASPVTSVSMSAPSNHPQSHPHHVGPHGGHHPHMMDHGLGPGSLGMMPNGISPSGIINSGPNQVPPNMGGPMHSMIPPNMGGVNMNQNGPLMNAMMGHNGGVMPGHPGMTGHLGMNSGGNNANVPLMGQMQPQQQMNCKPPSSKKKNTSDDPPEKKRRVKAPKDLESQGGQRAGSHYSEEPNSPGALKSSASDLSKLFELGPEPDRRHFLERIFSFLEESGQQVTALPVISKTPLDLYKLYFSVQEKGGFEEVTRCKKWRDICTVVNIGTSASAAFTLKKNYIRYLFNYECKFDRGGINPAPILAQMEAQLAHKREQKSRRAPSPANSNSNESFRPPSIPNSQVDSSYQPQNMPPPYLQNPDSNMPGLHLSGNVMMGPNNTMGGGPHGGMMSLMPGPPGMGPSGILTGSGPNMMHGQQGLMGPNSGAGNMMSSQMPGVPPGYGGSMMQQQQPAGPMSQQLSTAVNGPPHIHANVTSAGPISATSDNVLAQDPFADESGYLQQRGGPLQPTPPPGASSTPVVSSMQPSSMGSATITSSTSQQIVSAVGYGGPDQMMNAFPPQSGRPNEPSASTSGGPFPFGQPFEQSDRFDQSTSNVAMRQPGPTSAMTATQQTQQQEDGSSMYTSTRFSGPHQPVVMRPPQGGDAPGQYAQQGSNYQAQVGYPGPQYPNYPQNSGGPQPPGPGGIYVTPTKRFPDDHPVPNQYSDWSNPAAGNHGSYSSVPPDRQAQTPDDRLREGGQWSPVQRSRVPQSVPGYMSPAPPSTPPTGQYGRQMSHKNSPQSREAGRLQGQQKMPPSYGLAAASLVKKEITFPAGSVESVTVSATKRKKLTNKDLAPFESWRLMLALKSGLLAETTWALDTLNILLYDDTTCGYFGLNKLPGLLEVLTEHFRHCLMQMFTGLEDLEEGLSRKHIPQGESVMPEEASQTESSAREHQALDKKGQLMSLFSSSNYTMISRKGMPVKMDQNPSDCSVLDAKEWDVFCNFESMSDKWAAGHGDMTHHILTHLENDSTNRFLSDRFRRKRTRDSESCNEKMCNSAYCSKGWRICPRENVTHELLSHNQCSSGFYSVDNAVVVKRETCEESGVLRSENSGTESSEVKNVLRLQEPLSENSESDVNHSRMCNGETSPVSKSEHSECENMHMNKSIANEPYGKQEVRANSYSNDKIERKKKKVHKCMGGKTESGKTVKPAEMFKKAADFHGTVPRKMNACSKPLENGIIEDAKLSSILNHVDSDCAISKASEVISLSMVTAHKGNDAQSCINTSPSVPRAASLESDECTLAEGGCEPMNSSMNSSCTRDSMEANLSAVEVESENVGENKVNEVLMKDQIEDAEEVLDDITVGNSLDTSLTLNESCVSEELSASIVAEMLKEGENLEEEAFQKDDPPLCVTPESRDELGRRCVCISNIIRSLSCVPGNEDHISRHPGIMKVLGRLLLLHHRHPEKPPPRSLPFGVEEEEREQTPRVYDDEHWWWGYLDQLRENTLVIVANICGHLRLGNFSDQICFPLLEGLLHWVICPASVARDPLPTLPPGSVLSPQRLVLEALCKLCIHETNVDLLLATPPVKRLLELYSVLIHLLADRHHQITREFSIVLLSLLVSGDSSAARAVALQHPSVSLLVDFIETAEQNALAIASQQGIEVLQVNPEIMGTSLDMLRRAASILLQMARVPDNQKLFLQQQNRLLNLVMSQILDQTVSNTLSEVLFECSQVS